MSEQKLDQYGRYILNDFSDRKPFVNFLPGIAGVYGIPMWVFYVNRGQGISSFGIASKDRPIMEFQPANKAYRQTSLQSFRTFIKIISKNGNRFYEPFSDLPEGNVERCMYIGRDDFEIQEVSETAELQTNVLYYTVPNEQYAGLVRQLKLKNDSRESIKIEILDGTPIIIPYGVNDFSLKNQSRLSEAWMEVFNIENQAPYFRVRATTEDTTQVGKVSEGNFALSILERKQGSITLKPIVDPKFIFGRQTAFISPDYFKDNPLYEILAEKQHTLGQTPCAFFGDQITLEPGEEIKLSSLFGYLPSMEILSELQSNFSPVFIQDKLREARQLSESITSPIEAETANPIFDAYSRQTFLDNVMRGGMPVRLGNGKHVFHVYSRKHGDPEREYNYYYLTPENYSQGNGNFRDVNQNRRNDVFYFPFVRDYNLRFFFSLIQMDGYNPLSVNGTSFQLAEENQFKVLEQVAPDSTLREILTKPFTPGSLWKEITTRKESLGLEPHPFFDLVLSLADDHIDVSYGEGYWIDHWTYNLDLLDSFLAIYPDLKYEMLFAERDLPWFESFAEINPRRNRYQLMNDGLRQHNAVHENEDKKFAQENQGQDQNWVRKSQGSEELYQSSVFEKLFVLLVIKAATLDPDGMGVEMEAGKPGWYDALNGLPGLLGSSICETYETFRLASSLLSFIDDSNQAEILFPEEFSVFLSGFSSVITQDDLSPLEAWRQTSNLREAYQKTLAGSLSGAEISLSLQETKEMVQGIKKHLQRAINRIEAAGKPLPQTYFYYQIDNLPDSIPDNLDPDSLDFTRMQLPYFLEGPVHAMRLAEKEEAREIYQAVKTSGLYDAALGMYKVNDSLEECSHEIGRASAFPPGWLENESVWLHMEYKYLLEILRAGLYEEFYEDIQTALVPFMDADQYGRSPLENSSFIASSAYPDPTLHGNGFVARLSGSTAEFLTIWMEMFSGRTPFFLQEGKLALGLKPALAKWLFNENDQVSFTFLGQTRVTYHNPEMLNTWETSISGTELIYKTGKRIPIPGEFIPAPYAEQVRAGLVSEIQVDLKGQNHGI